MQQLIEKSIMEQKLQAKKLREDDTEKMIQAKRLDKSIQQERVIAQYENNIFPE